MHAKTIFIALAFTILGAVVAALATHSPAAATADAQSPDGRQLAQLPPPPGRNRPAPVVEGGYTPDEIVNIRVYEQTNRGVVNITTRSARNDAFFALDVPAEGSGSGAVLDKQGHVLTNFHVVDGAREVRVTLFTGEEYRATLVGRDATTDIAVLKIEAPAESLVPVLLGDSRPLKVGQRVFAIGNPFGLERTLTTGVISSLNRTIESRNRRKIHAIIQVDAAINPGNSGGPLLGSNSRLIGMNTAIASTTGQSAGVGFAIPVGTIARIVPQLIANGRVVRADVGVARFLETEQGLLIVAVAPGGPAEQAGLKGFRIVRERRQRGGVIEERTKIDRAAADMIVKVDGQRVASQDEFFTLIEAKQPGDTVDVSVVRQGKEQVVRVRLAADDE